MLRIEKHSDGPKTTIRLIGRLQAEQLPPLQSLIKESGSSIVLDLAEVDLVDIEAVRFLNACESAGVSILHCSPYIREWMLQERGGPETQSGS